MTSPTGGWNDRSSDYERAYRRTSDRRERDAARAREALLRGERKPALGADPRERGAGEEPGGGTAAPGRDDFGRGDPRRRNERQAGYLPEWTRPEGDAERESGRAGRGRGDRPRAKEQRGGARAREGAEERGAAQATP